MIKPLVSVVVINYNDEQYITDCLSSLMDQQMSEGEYEVIFADNGSDDGSPDIVRSRFPNVRLVEFDQNYGFCEGNNRAVEYTRGKYVAFLNVDTVVHRKWLSELFRVVESDPSIKACQSNMIMPWSDEFQPINREEFPQHTYYYDVSPFGYAAYRTRPFEKHPIPSLFLEGGSLLIEKQLIAHPLYAFDADLGFYCEDLDLALRVNTLGYNTVTVPTSVVYHSNSFSMKAGSDRQSVQKATQIVRNRILAFYKNMTNAEFVTFLPLLVVGAPFKVRQFGWSFEKQLAYGLGAIPVTIVGLRQAVSSFRRFRHKRQQNLEQRRRREWWLLRKMLEDFQR